MKAISGRSAVRTETIEPGGEWRHVRRYAAQRATEVLDEMPALLRRLRTFLLVASVTMVVFAGGLLVVLWKAVA